MNTWVLCLLAAASAIAQMRTVEVDAAHVTGAIRSLQGVNNGPMAVSPLAPDAIRQYKDLRIDLIRIHDYFGPGDIDARWPDPDRIAQGAKADAANTIFPDWNADPEKKPATISRLPTGSLAESSSVARKSISGWVEVVGRSRTAAGFRQVRPHSETRGHAL